jgi:hypothetical protein
LISVQLSLSEKKGENDKLICTTSQVTLNID